MTKLWLWLKRTSIGFAVAMIVTASTGVLLWQDRDSIEDIDVRTAVFGESSAGAVTVTWFGVTTLLFDDGETQILVDGFFTRPDILDLIIRRPLESDAANINYAMDEFRMRRLAAVIPVHSHYDHAMDVGAIANRSSASVVGTQSTANIARGAGIPDDQIITVSNGDSLNFGKFTVTLITSRHVPNGFGDRHLLPGFVSEPLRQPADFTRWREGGSWSILIGHPNGTTLVQGSAGFVEGALAETAADVVMLGVARLNSQGYRYTNDYWQETVGKTGARRIFLIHHDDFTQPFGQIELFPGPVDDVVETVQWLNELAAAAEADIEIRLPPFGEPLVLY
jgi:L-ascorbate metabolism protein UlaG (beta-lactamase superfamily)